MKQPHQATVVSLCCTVLLAALGVACRKNEPIPSSSLPPASEIGKLLASVTAPDGSDVQFREPNPGILTVVVRINKKDFWQNLDLGLTPVELYEALAKDSAPPLLKGAYQRVSTMEADSQRLDALRRADPSLFSAREAGIEIQNIASVGPLGSCSKGAKPKIPTRNRWCFASRSGDTVMAQRGHHSLLSVVEPRRGKVRLEQWGWHARFNSTPLAAVDVAPGQAVAVFTLSKVLVASLKSTVTAPEGAVYDHWGEFGQLPGVAVRAASETRQPSLTE